MAGGGDFDYVYKLLLLATVDCSLDGTGPPFQHFDSSSRASIVVGKHGAQDGRHAVDIRRPLLRSWLEGGNFVSDGVTRANFCKGLCSPERLVPEVQVHCALRGRQRTIAERYGVGID